MSLMIALINQNFVQISSIIDCSHTLRWGDIIWMCQRYVAVQALITLTSAKRQVKFVHASVVYLSRFTSTLQYERERERILKSLN